MGIQEPADDHEASSAVRGVILSALGIERATVLCNNAELANPLQSPTDIALEMSGSAEVYRDAK